MKYMTSGKPYDETTPNFVPRITTSVMQLDINGFKIS